MKVSIYNFKSIGSIIDYELKPLTILSGINSSGKSSFIQLFLLLKETIDLDSSKFQLYLDGDLYRVKEYVDVLNGKKLSNKLKVSFDVSKEEFAKFHGRVKNSLYDSFNDYQCKIEIEFDYYDENIYVSDFFLNYSLPTGAKKEQFVRFQQNKGKENKYSIESNNEYFAKNVWTDKSDVTEINYSSVFPLSYKTFKSVVKQGSKKDSEIRDGNIETLYPDIDSIKSYLKLFFEELYYVGPLREQPKDEYTQKKFLNSVGPNGENVAQVLENFKGDVLEVYIPKIDDEGITYDVQKMTLIEGVKYWMCEVFNIGIDIYSKKVGDSYVINLINSGGIETTIKHVGFGISQILPIIVEGLRMPSTGTLILEQPEIHLHPKIQSLFFDFLYSLTLSGKSIILETHSDHLITRMRRRIAEDESNTIKDKINLTFIESDKGEILFRNIPLDDFGISDYFPSDFIDKTEIELRAIVRAQMKKRMKKN